MPKKHANSNEDRWLSYLSLGTKPNIMARPTRTIVGMFRCAFGVGKRK